MGLNISGGGASGVSVTGITRLLGRMTGVLQPNNDYTGASQFMDGVGLFNSGTFTDSTAVNGIDAYGNYFEQTSSSVSGVDHGFFAGYDHTRPDHKPFMSFAFQIPSDITNYRSFIGLADMTALADISDADDFSLPAFGLQYSTGRGDSTFQAMLDDGTTQSLTDTGVTVAADTFYHLEINIVDTSTYKIRLKDADGTVLGNGVTTYTTNLPTSTTGLRACALINPQEGVAKKLRIYRSSLINRAFANTD